MRRSLLLLPVAFLLPACVFTSPVPLDAPGAAPFDEGLLGSWMGSEEDSSADFITIARAGEYEYVVRYTEEVRDRPVSREVRVHRTVLGGVAFLNVHDPDDSTYFFVRYELSGDELRLRLMQGGPSPSDKPGTRPVLAQFASSDSLRAAVLRLLDDPRIFGEEVTVLRRHGGARPHSGTTSRR